MTLLGRIEYLIQVVGVRPQHILVLTFTNQTVDEIVQRLQSCLGHDVAQKLIVTTMHSFCFALVRCFSDRLDIKGRIIILSGQARSTIVKDAWRWSLLEQERFHCSQWLGLDDEASWMSVFRALHQKEPAKYVECFVGSAGAASQSRAHPEGEIVEVVVSSKNFMDLFGAPYSASKSTFRKGFFSRDDYFFFSECESGKAEEDTDDKDAVPSDGGMYWATLKKIKLGEVGTQVAIRKGSVLVFAEIRTGSTANERYTLPVGDAEALVGQLHEIVIQSMNTFPHPELKAKFKVPKSPPKGSPAALRAAGNPRWRSEMAKKVFRSLVTNFRPEIIEIVNAEEYFSSEKHSKGVIPQITHLIEFAKRQGHSSNTYAQGSSRTRGDFYFIFRRYEEKMKRANAVDFHDLLVLAADLLEKHADIRRIVTEAQRYVLVDEFQDMNEAQLRALISLQREAGCVTVVGDDDQQIYAFNGSCSHIFERFREAFSGHVSGGVQQISLEHNYRSSEKILTIGNTVLLGNTQRVGKMLQPSAAWARDENVCPPPGLWQCGTPDMEAKAIVGEIVRLVGENSSGTKQYSYRDIAVLYRCFQSARYGKVYGPLEVELGARGIPFSIIREGGLWEKACSLDLLAYLRLIANPHDDASFLRVLNRPTRGCGKALSLRIEEQRGISEETGQHFSLFAAAKELLRASTEDEVSSLAPRSAHGLKVFLDLIETLQHDAKFVAVHEVLRSCIAQTGYVEFFQSQKKKTGKQGQSKAQADAEEEETDSNEEEEGVGDKSHSENEITEALCRQLGVDKALDQC
eukprot:gnl/MRDRNA2_/MRDRNA2_34999_c0_seq1.p1 gnl/MRDRNA2_/MRDRNA2_34999_c0~~gnl/MRDRNA2_/MRDRNA2_34999_c0_seq1.p1  ORF type:complete len:880 (-),score=194.32 gnl/MRDRNA2_/MRDRNA2_34999_c0_seq1:499-2901(-)